MARFFFLSEAASIGLHGMILIARSENGMNAQEIADVLGSSRHHVAKVLQRLAKVGFLSSTRGPNGGFVLRKSPSRISLLQIYEAIEGEIAIVDCPIEKPVCAFEKCIFNNVTKTMTEQFRNFLKKQSLQEYL